MASRAAEIPHVDHKNFNWSDWAACVLSCKFPMETVQGEDILNVEKGFIAFYMIS